MKRLTHLLLMGVILFTLLGCADEEEHEVKFEEIEASPVLLNYLKNTYGATFDWELGEGKRFLEPFYLNQNESQFDLYDKLEIDIRPFAQQNIVTHSFKLEPTCVHDNEQYYYSLYVIYNEDESQIIGTYMALADSLGGGTPVISIQQGFEGLNCSK